MEKINTEKYWNCRFENDWEMMQGKEQTVFFVQTAIQLLPEWFVEEVKSQKLSICDFGCAAGQAVDVLHGFFDTKAAGVDFSENAVFMAREAYPKYQFDKFDMAGGDIGGLSFDIGYTSNVLEHLKNPWAALEHTARCVKKYFIVLIPFRETLEIEEHCNIFNTDNIPLKLADMDLLFVNYMDCAKIPDTLYAGCQMLLLYGRGDLGRTGSIADITDAFEQEYTGKLQEEMHAFAALQEELRVEKEKNQQLEKQNIELADQAAELTSQNQELAKRNEELIKNNQALIRQNQQHAQNEEAFKKSQAQLQKQKEDIEEKLAAVHKEIQKIQQDICRVQGGRIYRMGLLCRRFLIQCVHTRDRRDFVKWFFNRICKKTAAAKALAEFDELENIKIHLGQVFLRQVTEELQESEALHLKHTNRVVIFAAVPFFDVGGGQRSAQLARTYNAMGYRVSYIYGFPCTEDKIPDMFIPANEHKRLDEISLEWFADRLDVGTLVIFEIPYGAYEPYLDMAKKAGCVTVYEHIDNWDTSLGCMFYQADVFKRYLQKVDIITVTAEKLGEKIEEYSSREYIYLPNAVNTTIFEPLKVYSCPHDLKRGKKTLLYFGSLWGEWFEWDKIDYIAEKCPDYEINLIGDCTGCQEQMRRKKKNVHFLGLKQQAELPGYLKYADYALLPFQNSAIGAYVSPLKIFEYIAMNVKVLATCLDDIQGYPNVYCSDSKEEWVKILKEDGNELVDSSAFISQNNWFARCTELMDKSGRYQAEAASLSVIILNYNNKKVIRRCVDTLLAHNRRYGYEIVVVDNGSTDGSYELLKQDYRDRIILTRNTKNGCSSGRNLGVKNANGMYICFLDSDQWVVSDYWLDSALQILKENQHMGAVGWTAGWFMPDKPAGPIVEYIPNRAIEHAGIWYRTDIAYLGTGGLVMKRVLFEYTGGFDEFYDPTCFEDTDLSLKIRDLGYELAYCPYLGVMHLPHQTTQSGSMRHAKLMKRNGEYFQEKWKKQRPELLEYYHI